DGAAGSLGVAAAACAAGVLAASYAPRTVVWIGAAAIAGLGLLLSVMFVRDTAAHMRLEDEVAVTETPSSPVLRACNQAGLVNNLNDALAWGLAPLYLARSEEH